MGGVTGQDKPCGRSFTRIRPKIPRGERGADIEAATALMPARSQLPIADPGPDTEVLEIEPAEHQRRIHSAKTKGVRQHMIQFAGTRLASH